jgi:hypothetical protein
MVNVCGHIDVGRGEECLWFDGSRIQGSSHAGSSGAFSTGVGKGMWVLNGDSVRRPRRGKLL